MPAKIRNLRQQLTTRNRYRQSPGRPAHDKGVHGVVPALPVHRQEAWHRRPGTRTGSSPFRAAPDGWAFPILAQAWRNPPSGPLHAAVGPDHGMIHPTIDPPAPGAPRGPEPHARAGADQQPEETLQANGGGHAKSGRPRHRNKLATPPLPACGSRYQATVVPEAQPAAPPSRQSTAPAG